VELPNPDSPETWLLKLLKTCGHLSADPGTPSEWPLAITQLYTAALVRCGGLFVSVVTGCGRASGNCHLADWWRHAVASLL